LESKESLKDQLARLQDDLAVRDTNSETTSELPPSDLDELAPESEFEEFEGFAELYPQIQPENEYSPEDPAKFMPWRRLGPRDYDETFFALPRPRWPNPGEPMTPEVWQTYHDELQLDTEAGSHLRRYFDWVRGPKWYLAAMPPETEGEPHYYVHDRKRYHDAAESAAQDLAWLSGLWRSRGIPIPTFEELENMKVIRVTGRGDSDR
jgi:hypothetical protein